MNIWKKLSRVWYKDEAKQWKFTADRYKRYIGYMKDDIKSKDVPPWKKREARERIARFRQRLENANERIAWNMKKVKRMM